jgi:methylmalonyl-CoA/ethylmalonyl-CoA epimerase
MATQVAYHDRTANKIAQNAAARTPLPKTLGPAESPTEGGQLTMSSSLTGILQVAITVKEIERATAFYRDVLGLPLLMGAPNMAFFNCGGVRLYLSCGEGSEHAGSNSFLYFKTPDIAAFLADTKAKSVSTHQEPQVIAHMPDHDLWLMWIKDSEGNLLGIMEERRT